MSGEMETITEQIVVETTHFILWADEQGNMSVLSQIQPWPVPMIYLVEALNRLIKEMEKRGWNWKVSNREYTSGLKTSSDLPGQLSLFSDESNWS